MEQNSKDGANIKEELFMKGIKNLQFNESKGLKGFISIEVRGKDGKIKDQREVQNLIVSAGKAGAASRINGAGSEAAFTYLAVGTGATAAAAGDTALQTEITDSGLARASATCTRVTTSVTNDTAQLAYTWSVSGTKAVTECGILNAASTGTLLGRQVFTAVNVQSGDSLAVTYKIQCS